MKRKSNFIDYRKIISVLLVLIILIFTCSANFLLFNWRLISEPEKEVVIFFVPHQDDETLNYGSTILHYLNNNYNVKIVLYTDGGKSRVQYKINLKRQDFVNARDREFVEACNRLGVEKNNIIILNSRLRDGETTVEDCLNIARKCLFKYREEKIMLVTFSNKSEGLPISHTDHYNMGKALNILKQEKKEFTWIKMIEPYVLKEFKKKYPGIKIQEHIDRSGKLTKALDVYIKEDINNGMYGVGYKSVRKLIDNQLKSLTTYYYID